MSIAIWIYFWPREKRLKLGLRVTLRAVLHELLRLRFHATLERFLVGDALLRRIFPYVLRYLHAAKVRTAHTAEMRSLCAFGRQGLVVEFACSFGIEREVELVFPAKLEARFANRVIAVLRAGMALR